MPQSANPAWDFQVIHVIIQEDWTNCSNREEGEGDFKHLAAAGVSVGPSTRTCRTLVPLHAEEVVAGAAHAAAPQHN